MKKIIFVLFIIIVAITIKNVPATVNECDNQEEEAYIVCLQEEKYFKENSR